MDLRGRVPFFYGKKQFITPLNKTFQIPGVIILLIEKGIRMFTSIKYTFCPNCKEPVEITTQWSIGPKSRIGKPTFYKCKVCDGEYSDGLKEWPEMTGFEKGFEIFRFILIDIMAILVAAVVIMFAVSIPLNASNNTMLLTFAFSAAAMTILCIVLNIRKVKLSKKRFGEAE